MRRWLNWILLIALAASLGVNAYFLSRWMDRPGPGGRDPAVLIERRLEGMPEHDADHMRAILQQHWPAIAERSGELHKARRGLRALLHAEEAPHPEALAAALEELRARTTALQEAFHGVYVAAGPELSPEGRKALAGFLRREGRALR